MPYECPPEKSLIVQHQLAAGYFETEDNVLRAALGYSFDEDDDDGREIQESIGLMRAGDEVRPAEEVFAELRAKYNIPEAS